MIVTWIKSTGTLKVYHGKPPSKRHSRAPRSTESSALSYNAVSYTTNAGFRLWKRSFLSWTFKWLLPEHQVVLQRLQIMLETLKTGQTLSKSLAAEPCLAARNKTTYYRRRYHKFYRRFCHFSTAIVRHTIAVHVSRPS